MNSKLPLASVALLCFIAAAQAQDMQSSFFLDNYAYSHRINPALQAARNDVSGYFGVGADNWVVSAHTNVGLNNFLFPTEDGQLVIGLDDYVSEEMFLSGLSPVNSARVGVNGNVISVGGKGKRGIVFNFEANIKSNNVLNVSKDVFTVLKKGGDLSGMQFSDFSFDTQNYLELALGFGKKCGNLSLGFKVKALLGVAYADVSINQMNVSGLGSDMSVNGTGDIKVAAKMLDYLDDNGRFVSPSLGKVGYSGIGVAFDLGAVYEINEKLELSASIGDLGGINWQYDTDGQLSFKYSDDFDIKVVGNEPSQKMKMLPVNLNAGLRYRLNNTFLVGLIANAKTGKQSFLEARGGITCTPGSVISLAVTGGINSFGPACGAALNLCLGPVNLFAGMDGIITSFTPQWIPVKPVDTSVTAGLVINW